jgi:hypothetical protein
MDIVYVGIRLMGIEANYSYYIPFAWHYYFIHPNHWSGVADPRRKGRVWSEACTAKIGYVSYQTTVRQWEGMQISNPKCY